MPGGDELGTGLPAAPRTGKERKPDQEQPGDEEDMKDPAARRPGGLL